MKSLFLIIFVLFFSKSLVAQSYLKVSPVDVSKFFKNFFSVDMPEKDEYETYSQYFERVKIPTIKEGKRFYFELPAITSYSPYDSILTVCVGVFNLQTQNTYRLHCDIESKKIRTYTARNGLGNSVRVTEYETSEFYLDSLIINEIQYCGNKYSDFMFSYDDDGTDMYSIKTHLNLPPKLAKNTAKKIKAVAEVNIDSYFDRHFDSDYFEPEFSSPEEVTKKIYEIHASISKLFLYDYSNKKVLLTIDVL